MHEKARMYLLYKVGKEGSELFKTNLYLVNTIYLYIFLTHMV